MLPQVWQSWEGSCTNSSPNAVVATTVHTFEEVCGVPGSQTCALLGTQRLGMFGVFSNKHGLEDHGLCRKKEGDEFGRDDLDGWETRHQTSCWELGTAEWAGAAAGGF